jgi:hypothetical protein
MEGVERETRDVFDDNLDDDEAVLEGHLLDLYAQAQGYHSFGAYAASMFRRGQWLSSKSPHPETVISSTAASTRRRPRRLRRASI